MITDAQIEAALDAHWKARCSGDPRTSMRAALEAAVLADLRTAQKFEPVGNVIGPARRAGAEAMRERAAKLVCALVREDHPTRIEDFAFDAADAIRALPVED